MILEDERDVPGLKNIISGLVDENVPLRRGLSFEVFMNHTTEIENEDLHYSLRGNLIEHLGFERHQHTNLKGDGVSHHEHNTKRFQVCRSGMIRLGFNVSLCFKISCNSCVRAKLSMTADIKSKKCRVLLSSDKEERNVLDAPLFSRLFLPYSSQVK